MKMDLTKIKFVVFDFDGVFTDNRVIVNEKGEEAVICNRSDGLGLKKLRELDIDLLILSTEENGLVLHRARKLEIACVNKCRDKLAQLKIEVEKRKLSFDQVAYVGNDTNDLDCLKAVGFPVVVADAHKDVVPLAKYQTKLPGGRAAVREICDLIHSNQKGRRS